MHWSERTRQAGSPRGIREGRDSLGRAPPAQSTPLQGLEPGSTSATLAPAVPAMRHLHASRFLRPACPARHVWQVCVASSFIAHSKATAKVSSESKYRNDIWCGLVHFG